MSRVWRSLLLGCGSLVIGGVVAAGAFVFVVTRDLPGHDVMSEYEPPVTTRIYAGDSTLIGEHAREYRLFVPVAEIPALVKAAFLSAEDKNFYSHPGIDVLSIIRAQINNLRHGGRPQGASTITQQVARKFLLSNDVTYSRKIREALLALRITSAFSKDHVLEIYLNEIFLGANSYGVAAAAINYFGKSLDDLTVAEAAYLAALPKAPSNYHPEDNKKAAVARRNWVIDLMHRNGYLSRDDAELAKNEDLATQKRSLGAVVEDADYFVEEVRRFLYEEYGAGQLYGGGLQVRATLDTRLQSIAADALRGGLVAYDRRHGYRGAIATVDLDGDWQAALKEVPNESDVPAWRVALVTEVSAEEGAALAFADGSEGRIAPAELSWARGPDAPASGNVVYVEARSEDREATQTRTGSIVRQLQSRLDALGYRPGPVDGLMGARTRDAVRRYEADNGLVESGEPGDDLLQHLEATLEARRQEENRPGGGPARQFALRQIPEVNGALVALDPSTGHVLALIGGFSHRSSEFNRATQAMRQPGSAIKPFIYAAALDNGFTPASRVMDAPFTDAQGPGLPLWSPDNYTAGEYEGMITLRRGLELSHNVMTVRLAHLVGMEAVAETAERMGVYDDLPPLLSMSLGAGEVSLLRLTAGYAEFVNGGRKVEPVLISRVRDRRGNTIYRSDPRPCAGCGQEEWTGQGVPDIAEHREQVLDPRTAYQIVSMLEGVVERGTGSRVNGVGRPLAGKTGTSSEWRDTWFIGFSHDLAVGVFVGFDTPRSLGEGETGSRTAAPIFRQFMEEALEDRPAMPFRIPPGVVLASVDPYTGEPTGPNAPGSILEAFKGGTEPGTLKFALDRAAADLAGGADPVDARVGHGTGAHY